MLGLPGSGKTQFSKELQKKLNITRLSLDEEYFKIVGNSQQELRDFKLESEIEERLKLQIVELLKNGESIILDYCPWKKKDRDFFKKYIEDNGGVWKMFYLKTPKEVLINRLNKRNSYKHPEHQFVTPTMLEDFYRRFDEPNGEGEEIVAS